MEKLISQKEISESLGISTSFVSFALAKVKPTCRKSAFQYNIDEARSAVIEYCERRAQVYAEKHDFWKSVIEKSKNLR